MTLNWTRPALPLTRSRYFKSRSVSVPKTRQTSLLSYGIAVLSVIAATLVTWSLLPLMQHSIFLFFIIAVMLSAWRGGHGPELPASASRAFPSHYFFSPPFPTIGPFDTTPQDLPFL